jgi:hypothetical protein
LSPSVRNANPPLPEELLIDQNPNRKLPVEKEHSNVRQPRRTSTQKKNKSAKNWSAFHKKKFQVYFFFNVFEDKRRIHGGSLNKKKYKATFFFLGGLLSFLLLER